MRRLLLVSLLVGCGADSKDVDGQSFLHHLPGFSTDPITQVFRDGRDLDFLAFQRDDTEVYFHHNEGRLTVAGLARLHELAGEFVGRESGSFGACGTSDGADLAVTLQSAVAFYTIAFCPFRGDGEFQALEDYAFDILSALETCTASELVSLRSCTQLAN